MILFLLCSCLLLYESNTALLDRIGVLGGISGVVLKYSGRSLRRIWVFRCFNKQGLDGICTSLYYRKVW
jgi:hypothetical protein